MGPYTFARLRRLIECEAQFLLSDHAQETPEAAFQRAGRQAMEIFLREAIAGSLTMSTHEMMASTVKRVLLADEDDTYALRVALQGLLAWYTLPPLDGVVADALTLIEHPLHLVLTGEMRSWGKRSISGSRPATPEEIAAGRSAAGWLFQENVQFGVIPSGKERPGLRDRPPAIVIDWRFDRALPSLLFRNLGAKLYALAVWIEYGSMTSTVVVHTVYPVLKKVERREFKRDDFLYVLAELEGLLLRADDVLDSGPATIRHTRVGARCETCPVTNACPAVDMVVRAPSGDDTAWASQAHDWILLRRRLQDLEARLREKARADGPIKTVNGYEVGFGGKDKSEFGVWRQRLDDDPLALVDPT